MQLDVKLGHTRLQPPLRFGYGLVVDAGADLGDEQVQQAGGGSGVRPCFSTTRLPERHRQTLPCTPLALLCHKRSLSLARRQHRHRGSVLGKAAAIRSRKPVLDDETWRYLRWAAMTR